MMQRLGLKVIGQAAKRGLVARLPTAEHLATEIGAWLEAQGRDAVRALDRDAADDGTQRLRVDLHPAAEPVRISVSATARVHASAATSPVGPGYHTFVCRLLHRLGDEHGIEWAPASAGVGSVDDTGAFDSGQRQDAERVHLAWLRAVLAEALEGRRTGAGTVQLTARPGVRFGGPEAAIATSLGPRDDAWLEAALRDPRIAVDIWPWFLDATDARHLLNRALCLIWTEVRWRPPALPGEAATMDEVLGLLRRAYPIEPSLPHPVREWDELLTIRGIADPTARHLLARASAGREVGGPPMGYRRGEVIIVHGGWALPVPGSFGERRSADEWWGGESGRSVTLAGTDTGTLTGPMSPEAFLTRVAAHLRDGALEHRDGMVLGRARIGTDASSGVEVAEVEGYMAAPGRGAAIRIVFDDPSDWKWALDLWRSLRPA